MANIRYLQHDFHKEIDSKRFRNRINNPFIQSKEKKIASLISKKIPHEGKMVLEIGCGEGSNIKFLQDYIPNVDFIGLDFSKKKIKFFNEYFINSNGLCGDAINLPFKKFTFDMVFFRDLLHHVDWARDNILSEAFRVLTSEGIIVVIESNGKTFLSRIFQFLYPAERGLKNSFSKNLVLLGEKYGKVKIEYIEASFLVRAIAFPFGWPIGIKRYLISPLYALALFFEKFVEWIIPKKKWAYMVMSLRRG